MRFFFMHDRYRPVNRTARTRRIMNQSDCEDALNYYVLSPGADLAGTIDVCRRSCAFSLCMTDTGQSIGLRVMLDYYILSPGAELAGTIGVCRRSCAPSLCMTDTGQSIGLRVAPAWSAHPLLFHVKFLHIHQQNLHIRRCNS